MAEQILIPSHGEVGTHCLHFHNPNSINGPFGEVKIIVDLSGEAFGSMKIRTIWGMGTVTTLLLMPTSREGNTYQFDAVGYISGVGIKPEKVKMEITVMVLDAEWKTAEVSFSGYPETNGGFPAQKIPCDGHLI